MKGLPYADADYCQYAEWGYKKPTRFWGSPALGIMTLKTCDGVNCRNLLPNGRRHCITLSSPHTNLPAHLKYRIPQALVQDIKTQMEGGFDTPFPPPYTMHLVISAAHTLGGNYRGKNTTCWTKPSITGPHAGGNS